MGTLFFTVYGQLIIKWRITGHGLLPESAIAKVLFLLRLLIDPFIFSGFLAAFIASLFWMAAMTKFEISYAYPFMSLAFVLVLIFSSLFLDESLSAAKLAGVALIVAGIIVVGKG